MVSYVANLQQVAEVGPEIAASIVNELENQRSHLKLVASENYCSLNVQATMGNLLTDKYAEGYPEHRYYGGCVNIDAVENVAAREAEALFGAEYAYVQPHSGADPEQDRQPDPLHGFPSDPPFGDIQDRFLQ